MAAPREEAGGTTDGGVERARGQRGPSTGKTARSGRWVLSGTAGSDPEGASRERRTSRGVDAHRVIGRKPR